MDTILYDVTHTSHCEANSGVQRVVRRLAAHWPRGEGRPALQPVVYDHHARMWRKIDGFEKKRLAFDAGRAPGAKRGASWNPWQRVRGRLSRGRGTFVTKPDHGASGFLCPELFAGDRRLGNFSRIRSECGLQGPLTAVFYDMIAIDMPGKMPARVVGNYPEYLEHLLRFDVIAAISGDSRDRLCRYWKDNRVAQTPRVLAVPLGVDSVPGAKPVPEKRDDTPLVLSVGTIEGRKNHLALLEAAESLWGRGLRFRLKLIGMLNKETGGGAAQKIASLAAAGRPVTWLANAGDRELFAAYDECDFTVYPSLCEGFGLPVLESLAHGRACVCSGQGAMSEIVGDGGGCVTAGEPTAANLERAIGGLLENRAGAIALSREALARKIRSWDEYASDIQTLII